MEKLEEDSRNANTRKNLDSDENYEPDENYERNAMGIKIQELIKEFEDAHSQVKPSEKLEEEEVNLQKKVRIEQNISYKNMFIGETNINVRSFESTEDEMVHTEDD